MATTFKAVVYAHHRKSDGTYNVKIRVTHNRQKRHIPTNIFVTAKDLTRGLKVKDAAIADQLKKEVERYQRIAATIPQVRAQVMTIDEVVEYINSYEKQHGAFRLDFIKFGEQLVQEMKDCGRVGTGRYYKSALVALKRYLQRDHLDISEVTVKLLEDFCNFIKNEPARPHRVKGERAPSSYLGAVRILHNKAKERYNDEDAGIIRIPLSPFKRFKVPKPPITRKRSITVEQLQAIMQVKDGNTVDSRITTARDLFLLSFGLIGMNNVDLYNAVDYDGERITYKRTKTRYRRADEALISIKVEPCVRPLVEKYLDPTGERVFNFHSRYASYQTMCTNINRGLKLIGAMDSVKVDDLEFYAARHTWATLARNKAKVEKATIHEALNHVDEQMRVTDIYLAKDYSQQDEANRRVLELVNFTAPQ
ncbi:phage integrase SAM-like domain-containing protein [uncultured Duncaniella sp.]|uniref:phage integrase SAM-like domain-containing protein n=1 Tax=uncultured Duncaniella sp. TaxID=2768039 RepID=UPI00265A0079|nr:phage integrase SAM-like domain-containing protein [uncultured Duncaniella sp.]